MRKYLIYFILSSIFPTFFLSSCGEDRSGEYYALIASKTWMYETMQQNYLFMRIFLLKTDWIFSISRQIF